MLGRGNRALVASLVVLLCAGALLLIILIVVGSGVDTTSAKAIWTVILLAFFSLTSIAGSDLARRRGKRAWFGWLTAALAPIAFLVAAITIWSDDAFHDDGKAALSLIIVAFAAGHASFLLAGADPEERRAIVRIRAATLVFLAVLVVFLVIDVIAGDLIVGLQPIGVVAVLYGLGAVLVPLLRSGLHRDAAVTLPHVEPARAAVSGLDHVVIAVSDWERSNAFYRDVLGAEVVTLPGGRTAYRVGAQRLNVHGPGADAAPLAADPVRPGNSDLCFAWPGSAEEAAAHLQRLGVEIVAGPVERNGARGSGHSVYCRDPDGSLIELISYE